MTIPSQTARADYTGNGLTSSFATGFRILDESHIAVFVRDTDNVETELTLTTHYTVTGVLTSSATVSLVAGAFDWLNGSNKLETDYKLTILRDAPVVQETDVRNQGAFYPEIHEDAFDYGISVTQQLKDAVDRSLKTPPTEPASDLFLPVAEDRAGKFLGFDSNGDPMASSGGVDIVPVSAYMETMLDDATASDALTTLGVSTYAKTLLDDADASAAQTTLGISTYAKTLLDDADAATTRGTLGFGANGGIVATGDLADASVTIAKMASVASGTSVSSGNLAVSSILNQTTTSTSAIDVTNSPITITTTGRPVLLLFAAGQDTGVSPEFYVRNTGAASTYVEFVRDSTMLSTIRVVGSDGEGMSSMFIDLPAAGTYTYKLRFYAGGNTAQITNGKLRAFEL